jgi:glycosyltransferase involved in cell wall biosynthesis
MFTNTYLPQVSGVARSVDRFTRAYRRRGHQTLVVAPTYEHQAEDEEGVIRLRSIQHFSGTNFSLALPAGRKVSSALDGFGPELIHSHHPFLIGDSALRLAASRDIPLAFTYHTRWENYTHYVPLDLEAVRPYIVELSTRYANLCDGVVAPSESMADILRERGVTSTLRVIPTGVDVENFADGDGERARRRWDIESDAFLIGHVGRLAPEKNLDFLAEAVGDALRQVPESHFLVVGDGESAETMRDVLRRRGLADRACFTGTLKGQDLVDAYQAMDVFVFASKADTQGMVLIEAASTGCPLVALDAPGAREVVRDHENGRLLDDEDASMFADAVAWVAAQSETEREALCRASRETAERFSTERCVDRTLEFYRELVGREPAGENGDEAESSSLVRRLKREWDLWVNRVSALTQALGRNHTEESPAPSEQADSDE